MLNNTPKAFSVWFLIANPFVLKNEPFILKRQTDPLFKLNRIQGDSKSEILSENIMKKNQTSDQRSNRP
jgi:hypothetical protein